jgi:tRNA G10  N-methylase Trm11
VLRLSEQIKVNSVDAIITEPYLGPQKPGADVRKVKRELDELYSKALGQFAKVLKAKGSVVMIWPRMTDGRTIIDIEPEIEGFKMVNSWPEELKNMAPKELVYGREGQRVWRRIVILVKK